MRLLFIYTAAILVLASSCEKDEVPAAPDDFSVTVQGSGYAAGDTVQFNLTGDPDMIIFYSGEPGKKYAYRQRTLEAGTNKLVFHTSKTQGVLPGTDQMQLLISENLNGYDAQGIAAATWTDITARNKKWPANLSTAFTKSDSIDISDFGGAGHINIAFRLTGTRNDAAAQRKWQLQNLTLNNVLADGTNTPLFSNFANTAWVQCDVKNNANAWNVGEWNVSLTSSLTNSSGVPVKQAYPIAFDPGTALGVEDNEDWLLTTAIDLKTTKADAGAVIKNGVGLRLTSYRYIFKTPGTYKVTFSAVNARLNGSREVVKEVEVTIAP